MKQGMGMWGEMLDSPEMQEMLNDPDKMREMMMPMVQMMGGDVAKLEEVRIVAGDPSCPHLFKLRDLCVISACFVRASPRPLPPPGAGGPWKAAELHERGPGGHDESLLGPQGDDGHGSPTGRGA